MSAMAPVSAFERRPRDGSCCTWPLCAELPRFRYRFRHNELVEEAALDYACEEHLGDQMRVLFRVSPDAQVTAVEPLGGPLLADLAEWAARKARIREARRTDGAGAACGSEERRGSELPAATHPGDPTPAPPPLLIGPTTVAYYTVPGGTTL